MSKFLNLVLTLSALMLLLPMTAAAGEVKEVGAEQELRDAVGTLRDGESTVIQLCDDITINGGDLKVEAGTLTILGQGKKISFSNGSLFLTNGSTVNLGTKEGDGKQENDFILTSTDDTRCVVSMSGSSVLNMYNGVAIRDSRAGGQAGGVQLEDKAVFNMYGGMIDNCVNWASVAGGVVIDGGASFNMYDGTIQNCSGFQGGAVTLSASEFIGGYLSGSASFHMYGGTIKDCQDNWFGGGAVCAYTDDPVSFIMDGGTITGCSADSEKYGYGGAIFIYTTHEDAVSKINKGEITGNSASYGGGLFVYEGTVGIADGVAMNNNGAEEAGDDLYNQDGVIALGKVASGQKLSACGCAIDGWYYDNADARWSSAKCGGEVDRMEGFANSGVENECALKAAHGSVTVPPQPVIVIPDHTEDKPAEDEKNPTTGANDFVGIAAAMAVISVMGAAVAARKK